MRRTLLLLGFCLGSAVASAGPWADLWSRPEQQGQRLLQQHKPAEAAQRFSDPRRRAYAELQAGHYPQAAEILKPFADADSQYNRGNALARAGRLKEALAAYDAALQKAPKDADIRHNRDLVAKALQQPPQQQGKQGQGQNKDSQKGQDQNKEPQKGQSASSGQSGGQENKGGHSNSSSSQGEGRGQGSSQSSGSSGSAGHSAQHSQGTGAQAGAASSSSQGTGRQANGASSSSQAAGAQASGSASSQGAQGHAGASQSAGAQDDAAAGAQYLRDQMSASASAKPQRVTGGPDDNPKPKPPPSESSLALDQWLQRIPEDSGELLRRKFLIEHYMRQQQESPR